MRIKLVLGQLNVVQKALNLVNKAGCDRRASRSRI